MIQKLGLGTAILAVAAVALGAFAPTASAEEGHGDVTLYGRGILHAEGSGLAAFKGRMDLEIDANRGILLVKDIGGNAVVHVEGNGETASWNGFTVYFGTGQATVVGRHVAVIVVGEGLEIDAVGKGWAYLKGRGSFTVNHRGPFPWNEAGNFAPVDDGGADPPPEAPAN
jgi:hypothetical protein